MYKRQLARQMRTVYGDHERFIKTYFSDYKGYYFTGMDAAETRMVTTGLLDA